MLQLLDDLSFTNPWRELDRLSRDLDRIFPRNMLVSRDRRPLNIYTSDDHAKVVVSVPGWQPEWFDISVVGNKLFIKGETRYEADDGGQNPPQEKLNRVVNLPFRLQEDTVAAAYENGLLAIDLERRESDKPKKIAITAAQ